MIHHADEFRRGWRVLLASSLGVACGCSPVPLYAIGVLAVPLTASFGWGRGEVMLAILPLTLALIVSVPFIGALADRIGVRPVVLGALAGFGACWASMALLPGSLPVYYAMWFLLGLVGGGSTPVGWTRGVVGWFVTNRGLALAVTLMGTGVTAVVLPPYAAWLIEQFGWRNAFLGIALLPLGIALPVAWRFFHEAPWNTVDDGAAVAGDAPAEDGVTLREALRDYRLWVLAVVILLVGMQTAGTITNFVPLLQDRGYSGAQAAAIAGTIGISIICGRLVTGYLIDRFWAPGVAFPLLVLPAFACLALTGSEITPAVAVLSAIAIGLAAGAETDLVAYLTARYFGLRHYGRIYGLQYAVFAFASGIAPFSFGRAFDMAGNYDLILYIAAGMVVTGALLLLTMGRYPETRSAPA
ncbi:MAG: MFS transporter [Chromatiales bacterium]|nr:MFS transporter [Chromatiales bacterium]